MAKISFSEQELTLTEVARHHTLVVTAVYDFFAFTDSLQLAIHPSLAGYAGLSAEKVRSIVLAETDRSSALSVLACVEAAIRIDYLRRSERKEKSAFSRATRSVYKTRREKARLEQDLLACWRDNSSVPKALIGALIGAFQYRHWLAHGRYWFPKFGQAYDYHTVYNIADAFLLAAAEVD